jgi:hypothetical protein
MVETQPGVFYPFYPIGYPLLAAAAYRIGGPSAAFLVNPVMTVAALLGAFLLARQFLSDAFALAVLFLLATHAAILHFGVAAWSHASDLAVATWSLYLACAWYRRPAAWKLALCGVLLAYAVTIRYTEVLLALPVAWLIGVKGWDARRSRKPGPGSGISLGRVVAHGGVCVATGLAGLTPLLWYHWRAFGSPLRTGYALTGQSGAFSWAWFMEHAPFAAVTLSGIPYGLFILWPLGIAAMWLWKCVPWREGIFLAWACIPTTVLYMAYFWVNRVEPMMYARFYLTTYPAVLIAAMLLLQWWARRAPRAMLPILVLLCVQGTVTLASAPAEERFSGTAVLDLWRTDFAAENLPPDAVIVSSDYVSYSLVYYTNMSVIYPLYYSAVWRDRHLALTPGVPPEWNGIRRDRYAAAAGNRSQEQLNAALRDKLLDYARAGRTVALEVRDDEEKWYAFLGQSFRFVAVAHDEAFGVMIWRLEPRAELQR